MSEARSLRGASTFVVHALPMAKFIGEDGAGTCVALHILQDIVWHMHGEYILTGLTGGRAEERQPAQIHVCVCGARSG